MSEIKLKDFILKELPVKEQKEKNTKNTQPEYVFTLEYENDVDFILRRVTSRTDKSLVCIVSQGQVYIKDNKSDDIELVSMTDQLSKFKSGMKVEQIPNFEKLVWAPFEKTYNWVQGRYVDGVAINYHFTDFLKNKEVFKILANKKLDPFHNSDLVSEYKKCPEKFDDTIRLVNTIQMIKPSFSLNDYWASMVLSNARSINLHANTIVKYKTEFDELNDKFLSLLKEPCFASIFNDYNVDFATWLKWILYTIVYHNHLEISSYSSTFYLCDYRDYLRMQKEMYGKIKEKYPKYWLSEKQILVNKYNDWKTLRAKLGFELNQNELKKFEYENEKYKVVIPLMSSDIIDEAHQQQHCVASYVDRIARGETHIVFIRCVDKLEESVLTVEINTKDEVCQVRGFMNRNYTKEEYDFMKEWVEAVGLKLAVKEIKDEEEN